MVWLSLLHFGYHSTYFWKVFCLYPDFMFHCLCFTFQPFHLLSQGHHSLSSHFTSLISLFPLNVSITPFPFPRPCVSLFCFKFQPHRCLLQGMLVSLHISLLMLYLEHHSSCSCRASCMSPVSRFPFIICWWFNVETVRVSDGAYPTTHSH